MKYKGVEIPKFVQGEGKWVPPHVIKEYYQSEKSRIDREINHENSKCEMTRSVNDCIDDFLNDINS